MECPQRVQLRRAFENALADIDRIIDNQAKALWSTGDATMVVISIAIARVKQESLMSLHSFQMTYRVAKPAPSLTKRLVGTAEDRRCENSRTWCCVLQTRDSESNVGLNVREAGSRRAAIFFAKQPQARAGSAPTSVAGI